MARLPTRTRQSLQPTMLKVKATPAFRETRKPVIDAQPIQTPVDILGNMQPLLARSSSREDDCGKEDKYDFTTCRNGMLATCDLAQSSLT